jgi:hypothetical protein
MDFCLLLSKRLKWGARRPEKSGGPGGWRPCAYKSRSTRFSRDYRRRAPAVRQTALARQWRCMKNKTGSRLVWTPAMGLTVFDISNPTLSAKDAERMGHPYRFLPCRRWLFSASSRRRRLNSRGGSRRADSRRGSSRPCRADRSRVRGDRGWVGRRPGRDPQQAWLPLARRRGPR